MNPVGGLDRDGAFTGFDLGPELASGFPVRVAVDVRVGSGDGDRIFRLVRRKNPGVAAWRGVDVQMETNIVLNKGKNTDCSLRYQRTFTSLD